MKSAPSPIEIIDFSDELKEYIRTLNYEWLRKYFSVEKNDALSLSNPREEILDKGGFIFYAKTDGAIVGTASLIRKSDAVFELSKMAVGENAKGKGIGKLLIEHCLRFAKEKNAERIVLYSNTQLAPAIHLYRKYGFREIPLESGVYERANIKMEKLLR